MSEKTKEYLDVQRVYAHKYWLPLLLNMTLLQIIIDNC